MPFVVRECTVLVPRSTKVATILRLEARLREKRRAIDRDLASKLTTKVVSPTLIIPYRNYSQCSLASRLPRGRGRLSRMRMGSGILHFVHDYSRNDYRIEGDGTGNRWPKWIVIDIAAGGGRAPRDAAGYELFIRPGARPRQDAHVEVTAADWNSPCRSRPPRELAPSFRGAAWNARKHPTKGQTKVHCEKEV